MTEEDVDMEDSAGDDDDGHVFKVDEILGTKVKKNVRYYKVRWTDTWETEENLHECQEAIDAFWERTGGKDKAKPAIVVNTEDPRTGKAFPLRQSKEEQSVSSKKRRKGTSKKSQRLKKRKLQESQSSSDEENDDEDENTDATGGKSSSLPSPQIGMKKVKRLKSKKVKNVNKELFGSEDGGMTDDGDDGDDEDESVPLKQLVASAHTTKTQGDENSMQAEGLPEEAPVFIPSGVDGATELSETGSGLAPQSTENVSCSLPQVPEGAGILDNSQSIKPSANEATAAAQDEVLSAAVSSATSETTATTTPAAASVTTTTTTTAAAATTVSVESSSIANERQKWCRLGRGSKGDSIVCSSGSEDEERTAARAKFILPPEVKIKEEEKSEEEEESFKRTAKIKASFVIRRYCETGGDMEVGEEEFAPPVTTAVIDDDEVSENNASNDSDYVPSPGSNSSSTRQAVATTPVSSPLSSLPCVTCSPSTSNISTTPTPPYVPMAGQGRPFVRPRILAKYQQPRGIVQNVGQSDGLRSLLQNSPTVPPNLTSPLANTQGIGSNGNMSSSGPTFNGKPQPVTAQPISVKEEEVEEVTIVSDSSQQQRVAHSSETANSHRPCSPNDLVSHAASKVATCRAVPCSRPVKYLSNEAVENLITRVLFYVKKLIEFLKLKPSQMPEHIQALITKSAVYTMGESYKGDKPQPDFLEQQINDLTQIVLKELPHSKLMPVVYQYALPNLNTPESGPNPPILSNSSMPQPTTFLATPVPPVNHLKQTPSTPAQVVNVASAGGPGMMRALPPVNVVVPPHMYSPQMMIPHPTAPIAMLHPRADNLQLRYPVMFPRPAAVNLGSNNINTAGSGVRPSLIQVRPTQSAPIVNGSIPRLHLQPQLQQQQQHGIEVLPSSSAIIQNIMESPPPLNQINCVVPERSTSNPSDAPMFNITSVRSLKLDPPQMRTKGAAAISKSKIAISAPHNSNAVVVDKAPLVSKSPVVSKGGLTKSPVSKSQFLSNKPTVSKSLVSTMPPVDKSLVAVGQSNVKSPGLTKTLVATCQSSVTENSTTITLPLPIMRDTTAGTSKSLKSPEVKTVLGPHRFYKPPPKKTNDDSVVASSSSEVILDDDENGSDAKKCENDDENTRYKDKVNKKFAKPISDPNKVIDLTDLTVESEPEDERKSQSEEDTEEEET